MKLISLYIESFGGLSKYALDFEDGLTVIEEANGFGKTTLAEFIRAMFYGFPRKAKTLDKNRRQKYTPWNGGKCGGNLVFEAEGCRYRVERTFGATPKSDTFTLIDLATNKKSTRYSEELGLELFQLDGESFERSTYMPQLSEVSRLTTDSIHSKLSDLVEDTNDVGNFEKAMAALKTERSTLVPYRGSSGSVARAISRVSQLQEQLDFAQSRRPLLESCTEQIEELQQQEAQLQSRLEEVRRQIHICAEAAATAAVQHQHRHMTGQLESVREECSRFRDKYPEGIPDWEQIENARNAAAQLEILNSRELTEQDDLDAFALLEENRSRFEGRVPAAEGIAACRGRCQQVSALRERTMELAEKLARQPDIRVNPVPLILLLLALVGGLGAGALLLWQGLQWGYLALGIGAAALIGSIFAVVRLAEKRKQLRLLRQQQADIRAEIDRLSAQAEQTTAEIEGFLGTYGPVDGTDFYGQLAELEHSSEDYLRAKARVVQWKLDKKHHEEELAQWQSVLDVFFRGCGLDAEPDVRQQLLEIRDDRKDWEEAARNAKRLAEELKEFCQANSVRLAQPVLAGAADPEALRQKERELTGKLGDVSEELLRQRQRRELLQEQLRTVPELRDELQQWQEKKIEDQHRADLLDETMALLEQAKENLAGSFMDPIRHSFARLLDRLWGKQEGQILVTPDLEVQLERSGAARELGYFSAGQTDMVMLCMRFALVDALFKEQKPFVVLDDPFVNLDDERTAEALALLQELSRDRQILYLTCNSSRTPK